MKKLLLNLLRIKSTKKKLKKVFKHGTLAIHVIKELMEDIINLTAKHVQILPYVKNVSKIIQNIFIDLKNQKLQKNTILQLMLMN